MHIAAAKRPKRSSEGLMTWKVIETKMPWSLMFLLGGGFAISRGSIASCMAKRVGEALLPLRYLPPIVILALICFFEGTITEFTSNVGIANITLPVIARMVHFFIFICLCIYTCMRASCVRVCMHKSVRVQDVIEKT